MGKFQQKHFSHQDKKSTGGSSIPQEAELLKHLTYPLAHGKYRNIDVKAIIGIHECILNPPSLFDSMGNMHTGLKSALIPILLK